MEEDTMGINLADVTIQIDENLYT